METRYFYVKTHNEKITGRRKIHYKSSVHRNYKAVLVFILVRIRWRKKFFPQEGLFVLNSSSSDGWNAGEIHVTALSSCADLL